MFSGKTVHPSDVAIEREREAAMSRRRGTMSEALKTELARELGFYDTVAREGWGGIKARDAGNMVKRAIEIAEQTLSQGKSR